jgi:predicted aspartyl protease
MPSAVLVFYGPEVTGKLEAGHVMAATVSKHSDSRLLFIVDRNSRKRFLIDTGAEVSVIPPSSQQRHDTSSIALRAANGSAIKTYGRRHVRLDLGLRRQIDWIFIIADVPTPIIGFDLLQHYNLLVDANKCRLIDGQTKLSVNGVVANTTSLSPILIRPDGSDSFRSILLEFPTLTTNTQMVPAVTSKVVHHIETKGPPVFAKPRRLAADKLKIAREQFEHCLLYTSDAADDM